MIGAPAEAQLSFGLCLVFILLVPFAIAGLALLNAGLGRARSAAHAMTGAVCVAGVAILIYFVWGYALQGFPSHAESLGWPAADIRLSNPGFLLRNVETLGGTIGFLLAIFSVGIAAQLSLGSSADRLRLAAACASTVLLAGLTYPLAANFAWHGLRWGTSFGPGYGFLDAGGSGAINVTGGLTALSIAWLLGPRQGKYPPKGMPAAIPAHNQVYVLFGCMLAWVGWLGLNSAGAMLYTAIRPELSVLVVINTTFAAVAAALTAAIVTRIRFRRPDASLIANGWMAGLVASSAGCAVWKPAAAILIGIVAGALVVVSVERFELHLKVDDPCGSISVHAVCGIWGLLAVGIFSGSASQFTAQIVGIATLLGLIFPMVYGLNWVLNRFVPYRVSPDGERQGLDLHELGADAYPEFVVHSDEFLQR
jgi:ammonium transporter, Amt family